ncbi:Purple acid phosphatase [Operophtera brumata]|uniref:Purple acid phosphatase n=1 Tax=Operophtera brumata TaxID=104452 RepID=A0A0L7LLH1_OPEBR|nr:Purple acid phosphatase [Operophtera brumata]
MVNIIDDELWNPEPALRPEDEIILRKLHEMLQSTADDLKLLSGELSKFHEPGVQVKTAPTPLDEEFNEKVHIEEVVNAKFHGYKIIETQPVTEAKPPNIIVGGINTVNTQRPKIMNTGNPMNATITKRPVTRNLGISQMRIMQINDINQDSSKNEKLNNGKVYKAPKVAYDEFCYEHIEPEVKETPRKLQVQDMPRINIRSELKEQKVLQLDIVPDSNDAKVINTAKNNVSVVAIKHEIVPRKAPVKLPESVQFTETNSNKTRRLISKMSTCDSSGSGNNISSDAQVKHYTQKRIITSIRNSPKSSARNRNKKNTANENEPNKRRGLNLDEWKKKLNLVYGSSGSKKTRSSPPKVATRKTSTKMANVPKTLNNADYIPYSKLTVGGLRASDIEREISDLPNKKDIPLSPILDIILSSRENSNKESPRKHQLKDSPKILTTSDENLLQEVIDIEKSVSQTISKNLNKRFEPVQPSNISSESSNDKGNESYADDFEDEKSDQSGKSGNPLQYDDNLSVHNNSDKSNLPDIDDAASSDDDNIEARPKPGPSKPNKNTTCTKSSLSFKDSVDIFEFIHSVDMQDTATQSNTLNKIIPKETQTSPRTDKSIIQPTIHNDLWPSSDPRREVEKLFEMEKDFIKKLIIDEYGDLLEKNINKPSTSNENKDESSTKNESALQKNTQTSPARVKSIMTSPKRTKTRTTSPFNLSVPVNQTTSPMIFVTAEEQRIDVTHEADDISVNLSSPRFSLRLPQNSREVLLNLDAHSRNSSRNRAKAKSNSRTFRKTTVSSSSSSVDVDNSSELSSLGEVKIKKLRKRVPSISECSSSSKYSSDFLSMGILPLRSEGEVSFGQVGTDKKSRKNTR